MDIIFVPGIAFDLKKNRIGYGKGYYDKFIQKTKSIFIGVCHDFQLIEGLPADLLDKKVNKILTEKRIIN